MSDISIQIRTVVQDAGRESAWTAYEASFAPLRTRAMQRACMTRAEFDDCMADVRIAKYLALDPQGEVQGIGTMTNAIEAIPLVSPEFFEHRWPEHYAAGLCYYIGIVAAAPDRQGTELFTRLIQLMSYTAWVSGGIGVLDVCQANVEDHKLPQSIARICGQVIDDIQIELVDTQTYWAYSAPLPAQRRITPDHVIDLREISELAVADLDLRGARR